jgi:hypothetical protein
MHERDSIQSLLTLRKMTRAIADTIRTRLTEQLATLAPLFRPQTVLGDHIVGGQKESTRRAEQALKEMVALYEAIAPARPFNLRRELTPPFSFSAPGLEITPVDYVHPIEIGGETRRITVRAPLTWTLSYAGFAPSKLPNLLDVNVRGEQLQTYILSHLMLNQVTTNQRGLTQILEALHFPITTVKATDSGELPMTRIGVGISTARPADAVVAESAELTGMDAFEEVVNVEDISALPDPFKQQLLEIARRYVPELVAS